MMPPTCSSCANCLNFADLQFFGNPLRSMTLCMSSWFDRGGELVPVLTWGYIDNI